MATPEQIPTDLTLEIGDDLSPERFVATARAFFGYVQEISLTVAPEGDLARWIVRVREGSTLLAIDPTSVPEPISRTIFWRVEHGIKGLEDGNIEEAGLPDAAVRHLKTLAELAEGVPGKSPPLALRLWVKRKAIPVEPNLAKIIREDQRADYNDYGTIEGRLQTIQEGYQGSLQFHIVDMVLRQKVRCYFPEELLPDVFEKFRKRVEVSGVIHYRKNGTPISIEAERIDALPDDSELPNARDVRGILRIS